MMVPFANEEPWHERTWKSRALEAEREVEALRVRIILLESGIKT